MDGIYVLCLNSASDPEEIRKYLKEFRLGKESNPHRTCTPVLFLLYISLLGATIRATQTFQHKCKAFSGLVTYYIRPMYLEPLYDSLERLTSVIHCVANKHYPSYHDSGFRVPLSIPLAALEEIDYCSPPGISLFRGHSMPRTNDKPGFATREPAIEFATTIQKIWVYYVHYLTYAILESLAHGYHSAWHPSAPINVGHEEMLQRTNPSACYGSGGAMRFTLTRWTSVRSSLLMEIHAEELFSWFLARAIVGRRSDTMMRRGYKLRAHCMMISQSIGSKQGFTINELDTEIMALEDSERISSLYMITPV
ncbi:hypothetical protein FB451DRAFT_1189580 [Mycena latifolia]|nr:hypothetical protein FB451DRAFT_1189580 [Mycena latifolia]